MTEEMLMEDTAAIGTLEGLLDVARSAGEASITRVLESAAEAIARTAGFRIVFMNVFRPASNDFSTAHVHGTTTISAAVHDPPLPRDIGRRTETQRPGRTGRPIGMKARASRTLLVTA